MATDMYELLRRAGTEVPKASYDADILTRATRLRAMGAVPPVAPVVAPTSPIVPPTESGALYRAGRQIGKWGGRLVAPLGLGAMGIGMADKAADISASPGSKGAVENTLNILSGADVTGFGGWLGRKITGRPEPSVPALIPASPGPLPGTPLEEPGQFPEFSMAGTLPSAATPGIGALPPVEPFTAEDIRGTRRPVSGTGAFVNSRGEVTNLDTRASTPVVATPEVNYGSAGNMIGAMMNQRRAAATRASELAINKLLMDYELKAPAMAESTGKAQIHAATLEQARRAAVIGATPSEISLILAGRAGPTTSFGESVTSLPDPKTGAITLIQKTGQGAGAIRKVVPQQKVTEANIQGFLKDNPKMTRAQALAAHKAKGMDVSGL